MPTITKAELADELKVSRARLSQLLAIGLPVRSDGKIDRAQALRWLAFNMRYSSVSGLTAAGKAAQILEERG
jgi:phage terminase Nu1 subunit (DNA packaging protein)